jgi:hypothetical protein
VPNAFVLPISVSSFMTVVFYLELLFRRVLLQLKAACVGLAMLMNVRALARACILQSILFVGHNAISVLLSGGQWDCFEAFWHFITVLADNVQHLQCWVMIEFVR